MIAHLRGRLLEKQPTRLVVEAGGVGFEVLVPLTTAEAVGEAGDEVSLHTVLVVREDALTLYGFRDGRERALFLKLISVSGIGPKIALNALSVPSISELVGALKDRDVAFLTRLPGIGKKTAERMSLELKDALTTFEGGEGVMGRVQTDSDAVAALLSLGYTRPAAHDAVKRAVQELGSNADVESLIRTALGRLGGGKTAKR